MKFSAFAAALHRDNRQLFVKLAVVVALMFGFGYAMVPFYKAICNALGINVLSLAERQTALADKGIDNGNGQIDYSREITVEFDTNARGPWDFKPAVRHMTVHPGELTQVMYEFRNVQNRTMSAQAIPSYAPMQAAAHFNKLECFCFNEYTLKPGESKQWPVVFVVDSKLPRDVKTITLSYTFFEVAGKGGVKVGQAPKAGGGSL
ncbi:cytochrome c oxidase assembly protein [Roseateles sp. BYS78W]|uniref:Cytochrome c oxidase assembly protein CtaG n=1 Tax=Pelomonas candidula TaxID=3299025 RepID=A0ABW7HCJ3_9BURK